MSVKQKLNDFTSALKRRFDESPEQVLIAGAALIGAAAKIIDATSKTQSRRAYARKMNHSIRRVPTR